ncbi:MAG: hypothetical protein WDA08_04185 [Weeksellaceae bacterium]|jgi:hypothetical protein|nr:hypothetical protein [Weeksellaceae bacterium]
MSHTAKVEDIDAQIANYVNRLSEVRKKAVLTVAKTFAEDEAEEFEKKWATGISEEETFGAVHDFIKTLKWEKKQ